MMSSFPKYKYPYKRCLFCNHRLKPKYLQNNVIWSDVSNGKVCCRRSFFYVYGLVNYLIFLSNPIHVQLIRSLSATKRNTYVVQLRSKVDSIAKLQK